MQAKLKQTNKQKSHPLLFPAKMLCAYLEDE